MNSNRRNPIVVLIVSKVTYTLNITLLDIGLLYTNLQRLDLRLLRELELEEKKKRVIKIIRSINY